MRLFDLCVAKKLSGGGGGGDSRFTELVQGTITTASDANVTFLRGYAFAGCIQLTSVDFPNVTDTAQSAFMGTGLKSVYLPKLMNLRNEVFLSCTSLSRAEFLNVTSIYSYAFDNCPELSTLILHKRAYLNAQNAIPSRTIVYVEDDDLEWYSTSSGWSKIYANGRIKPISELPSA